MAKKSFNHTLSRQIDATHIVLEALKAMPKSARVKRRAASLKARLRMLEARIP